MTLLAALRSLIKTLSTGGSDGRKYKSYEGRGNELRFSERDMAKFTSMPALQERKR